MISMLFKKLVQYKLKFIARKILNKHKPKIIGISGSVGKTSAKEAIRKVLEKNFKIYASEKSMNTDFGLPVTIFRTEPPDNVRDIIGWIKVFTKGIKEIYSENYPDILILEMGVDSPGDMGYLLSIVKPDISIITGLSPVHAEYFGGVERILEEKSKIIVEVPEAHAVINIDFGELKGLSKEIKNKKLLYSVNDKEGNVVAEKVETTLDGLKIKILYKDEAFNVTTKLFGEHSSYAVLAAFSVGVILGMEPKEIVKQLKDIEPMPGRMNLLKGVRGSLIIDDSYNSSPLAVLKALEAVDKFKKKKNIIVALGSMNELGEESESEHRKIGAEVAKAADVLVTVGEAARNWIATEAMLRGLEKVKIQSFMDPFSAGEYLERIVSKDDLVLLKGSQNGVFIEEAVKYLLDKRYNPEKVLVRQSAEWLKKKEKLRP